MKLGTRPILLTFKGLLKKLRCPQYVILGAANSLAVSLGRDPLLS
jgi:hypothetical protein